MENFIWVFIAIVVITLITALIRFLVYRMFRNRRAGDPSNRETPDRTHEEYYSNKYMGGFNGLERK